MKRLKPGTPVVAIKTIHLCTGKVKRGTRGRVCHVSSRLRHVPGVYQPDCVCLKFPGVKSFAGMRHEVRVPRRAKVTA